EVGRGVVHVGLVPLLVGRPFRAAAGEDEEADGERIVNTRPPSGSACPPRSPCAHDVICQTRTRSATGSQQEPMPQHADGFREEWPSKSGKGGDDETGPAHGEGNTPV